MRNTADTFAPNYSVRTGFRHLVGSDFFSVFPSVEHCNVESLHTHAHYDYPRNDRGTTRTTVAFATETRSRRCNRELKKKKQEISRDRLDVRSRYGTKAHATCHPIGGAPSGRFTATFDFAVFRDRGDDRGMLRTDPTREQKKKTFCRTTVAAAAEYSHIRTYRHRVKAPLIARANL